MLEQPQEPIRQTILKLCREKHQQQVYVVQLIA